VGKYFSHNQVLALTAFYEMRIEKRFFPLLKFLHFMNNEGYNVHVHPKIYIVKPVFDYQMQKFQTATLFKTRCQQTQVFYYGRTH
jgi:hypothetical protein